MMRFLAAWILPVTSSSRAEAIQAGGWFGLVSRTDLRRSLAFLTSLMSPPCEGIMDWRSVRYPLGSTTVWPVTESELCLRRRSIRLFLASPILRRSRSPVGVSMPVAVPGSAEASPLLGSSVVAVSPPNDLASMASDMGVYFSLTPARRCFRFLASPTSGMEAHSVADTSLSSLRRSENCCWIFGLSCLYLSTSLFSLSSLYCLRFSSILSSMAL